MVKKGKILVVDDDRTMVQLIDYQLQQLGYSIVGIATEGKEAIQKVKRTNPDLVLMDIMLKGDIDGIEAADQIRNRFKVPVIFLTAYEDDALLQRAKIADPLGYILKPFKERDLYAAIEIALYKHVTEEKLRESEETYKTLTETSPDAITVTDLEGNITYASAQTLKLHGFNKAEKIIGKPALDLIAPKDHEHALSNTKRTLEEGVIKNAEYTLLKKDGTEFIGELSAALIKDVNGNPKAFIATTRDITKRKRAEKLKGSIYRISEAAHTAQNLEELFGSIHHIIEELMPAKNFYIALYNPATEVLSFPYFVDEYDETQAPKKPGKGLTEYVLRTGEPLLASPEVFEGLAKKGEVELIGAPSIDWLGVPLKTGDKAIGVLVVQSYTEGVRFGEEEKDILRFVSDQVATAIERKRAEEVIYLQSQIAENMAEGVCIIRVSDGLIVYTNNKFDQMFGYNPGELVGQHVSIVNAPSEKTPEETANEIIKVLNQTGFWSGEVENIKKDGTRFCCHANVSTFEQSQYGTVWISVHEDITERKQAEEALRGSEERYRAIFEQAADSIVLIDVATGAFVAFNDRAHENLGYTRKEFKKLTISDFEAVENREEVEQHIAKIRKEGWDTFETKHQTKAGEIRIIHVSSRALTIGRHHFIQSIWSDITDSKRAEKALKKSEERYRDLISDMYDGFVVTDENDVFTLVNQRMCEIFGCSRETDLVGHSIYEFMEEDEQQIVKVATKRRKEGVYETYEATINRIDGKKAIIRISASPVVDENGKYIGSSAVITDLTNRKEREKLEASLYAISEAANSAENLDELYPAIHGIIKGLMPARNFYLALLDPVGEIITWPYFVDEHTLPEKAPPRKRGKGITEYISKHKKNILIDQKEYQRLAESGEIEIYGQIPVHLIGSPLKIEQEVIGVLAIQTYSAKVTLTKKHTRILGFVSTAIAQAINRKRAEENRNELVARLREALVSVKTLAGLVPICAWCKKIRDDQGYWQQVDAYVEKHTEAEFSHGICPECKEKHLKKKSTAA